MKLNKFFMLGLAGLAFAACSNEDNAINGVDGEGLVAVRINLPGEISTKAVNTTVPGANKANLNVTVGTIKITLTAGNGEQVLAKAADGTWTLGGTEITEGTPTVNGNNITATFKGVENPQSIAVVVNEGNKKTSLADLQGIAIANTYMEGASSTFDPVPAVTNGADAHYTATVDMEHTMARVEFSGIIHKEIVTGNTHAADKYEGKCRFATATLSGIFLNNIVTTKGQNATNYTAAQVKDADFFKAADATCPVKDAIANVDFLTNTTALPEDVQGAAQCYAYNIFPAATSLPTLTLYFSAIELSQEAKTAGEVWPVTEGFAMVSKYKLAANQTALKTAFGAGDDMVITKFPAGYVYQVIKLEVADQNIYPTMGEGFDLIATINVTPWQVAAGEVEWK